MWAVVTARPTVTPRNIFHRTEHPVIASFEPGERWAVMAKCLLIATGANYRRLPAEGCEQFEGWGVYYAATFNEAQMCKGSDVVSDLVVVGSGNSAGQAAVFLAAHTRKVCLVIRGNAVIMT